LRAYLGTDGAVIDAFILDGLIASAPNISSNSPAKMLQDETELRYVSAKHNAMCAFERSYLFGLMTKTAGNITAAARLSGTDRRQLGKLLKKHHIETGVFR